MRIIAGTHRGTALAAVGAGDQGAHLRPTSDRVRESLFNVLAGGRFGDPITGVRVLDLFAGTGALGLEALSRGAAQVTFVDDGKVASVLIRENLRRLRREADARLIQTSALSLPLAEAPCGLIFLDPPYGKHLGAAALAAARAAGWVAPGALVVWEEDGPQSAPGFARLDHRRTGGTHVTLLTTADPA